MDPGNAVSEFLLEELAGQIVEIDVDTPLLSLIDSLGLMRLVAFVEDRFEIEIDDFDITPNNFRSVAAISAFLESRGAGRSDSSADPNP